MNHPPITANATYCATLVDQLVLDGVTQAFVAPGSRSTPLALALVAHPDMLVSLFHDERSAAFAALGHGLATGTPGVVLCTSGTAAAHFYGAVIEADASAVPLIVCSADRPPELWGRGAPQTIDQTHLYGSRVRAFVEPGPPDDIDPAQWRPIARQLYIEAVGAHGGAPGPVHANLSFRDPLTGAPGPLPAPIETLETAEVSAPDSVLAAEVAHRLANKRGVIIAGRNESDPADIMQLAGRLGWPVIADHRSGCRDDAPSSMQHFDSLLRSADFAARHRPQVVLRIGEIVSSKATSQWLTACHAQAGTDVIASRPQGRHIDPEAIAQLQFDESGMVAAILHALPADAAVGAEWLSSWVRADQAAIAAVEQAVAASPTSEVALARNVIASVPAGGALVLSSSMPVRDVEWFGQHRNDVSVFSNRGANGIDGVIATAIGVALSGQPTVCFIGDVAYLHDSTSLVALAQRPVDLTVVVTNNDGGGIFSFLPQHDLLDTADYELLFGTPHGSDVGALAMAHNIATEAWPGSELAPSGVRVVVAQSDRTENLALHDHLHELVRQAVSEAGS